MVDYHFYQVDEVGKYATTLCELGRNPVSTSTMKELLFATIRKR